MLRYLQIILAWICRILAVVALISALCGATHQLLTAFMASLLSFVFDWDDENPEDSDTDVSKELDNN